MKASKRTLQDRGRCGKEVHLERVVYRVARPGETFGKGLKGFETENTGHPKTIAVKRLVSPTYLNEYRNTVTLYWESVTPQIEVKVVSSFELHTTTLIWVLPTFFTLPQNIM